METNEILKLQALKYKAEVMKDHPGLEQLDGEPDWMYEGLIPAAKPETSVEWFRFRCSMKSTVSAGF